MDILSLRLFLSITEHGTVRAAARELYLSPASASARLSKLEATVGFRLFNRTTRQISLTIDGVEFLPYAQQCIETLEMGLSKVSGQNTEGKGMLRMAMPGSFGRMHIVPLLAEFKKRYPLINLDLRLSDEILNMVEESYDLVIRNAPLQDSSFIARKLVEDQRILVASPAYLECYGRPRSPEDLVDHNFVIFSNSNRLKFQDGQKISCEKSISINDGEAMRTLVESGLGIGFKSLWNVAESLDSKRLVQVLPEFPLITESSIWALYPSARIVPSKVRTMIDFLLEKFNPIPPWEK